MRSTCFGRHVHVGRGVFGRENKIFCVNTTRMHWFSPINSENGVFYANNRSTLLSLSVPISMAIADIEHVQMLLAVHHQPIGLPGEGRDLHNTKQHEQQERTHNHKGPAWG